MFKRLTIFTLLILTVTLILTFAACGAKPTGTSSLYASPASGGKSVISATWVKPQIVGDTISIPVSEVKKDVIVHFRVSTATSDETFMTYEYRGTIYARAAICPPCLSDSFSLVKTTLVCDTCGTVFDAKTGAGISGPCVRYPKAPVTYQVNNGNLVMTVIDLEKAFQTTLIQKKP